MEILKEAYLSNRDGTVRKVLLHPVTKVLATTVIILILIFASGYVMRIITHAVREYKNLQAVIHSEVQVVRVPA